MQNNRKISLIPFDRKQFIFGFDIDIIHTYKWIQTDAEIHFPRG